MGITELEALKSLASARIETLAGDNKECHFMRLSAELRNKIYLMIAIDVTRNRLIRKGTSKNGLAMVNKKISHEYLSLRNSKETISVKYLESFHSLEWVELDAQKLLHDKDAVARHNFWRSQVNIKAETFSYAPNRDGAILRARSEPAVDWVWDDMDADVDFYQDPNMSKYYLQGIAIFGEGEEGSVLFDLPIQLVERYAKPGGRARDRIKEVVKK